MKSKKPDTIRLVTLEDVVSKITGYDIKIRKP